MKKLMNQPSQYYQDQYLEGRRQGWKRRQELRREGLPLETMGNNRYKGNTYHGLYGYMDGMEWKVENDE